MKYISVKGAKMHNLKNISVDIPKDKLVVITGVSGSGKSSLAFDTVYSEGQRRYVESLSTYARNFLQLTEKPEVDSIEGLSPAISIDQKSASRNPRSTVGTITEIYDYLRLLFAKVGHPHCPKCDKEVSRQSSSEIVKAIEEIPLGKRIMILSPVVVGKKGEHIKTIESIKKEGFIRVRVDGEIHTLNEEIKLDSKKEHNIEIIVDRIVIKDFSPKKIALSTGEFIEEVNPDRSRLVDSIELALRHGQGAVTIVDYETKKEDRFSEKYACSDHSDIFFPEIEPRSFSFNSPHGACLECHGLGTKLVVCEDLVVPNNSLTLSEGAIHPWASHNWQLSLLEAVSQKHGFSMDTSFKDLTTEQRNIILWGTADQEYETHFESKKLHGEFKTTYEGIMPYLERRYLETDSENSKKQVGKYMHTEICPQCEGNKLRKEILHITILKKNIMDITSMNIEECQKFFRELSKVLKDKEKQIASSIIEEILNRLLFLFDVGLSYLTLNRSANTLSGGEAQRIRLATQIGSALQGVLYVLDEPSIGLHQKDNSRLIKTMENLRNLGNSVIVVEHDEETMLAADYIIEIGPGAGKHGGKVIAEGTPEKVMKNKNSVTGAFLAKREEISIPSKRREGNGQFIEVYGANANNLKNVDIKIPLGTFVGVSGVSGSGKSTLINGILGKELSRILNKAKAFGLEHEKIVGIDNLDKIIHIDQSPIGRTPRSNPATYTGVFTDIRDLFASQPDAKMRGYSSGRFSFNVKGGRCEACSGDGVKKIEMHFLPDVYVSCDVCHGKRYNQEALEIKWRGKSIADVLEMTVSESLRFFEVIPIVHLKLKTLEDVGLGYIHLGQIATTLSGGEAQRIKLSTELARKSTGKTIYILDEPTTGLHFQDVKKLLDVLQVLVDKGNTVVTIEHNLDVIKTCDYILDLGPDGGDKGGELIACGTPEEVAKVKKSYTGQYLKKMI